MIKYYPYNDLGHHDLGWLDARYHFSFSEYHNSQRMGFGALRVINDDIIQAGNGFDTHPHKDMEIITYVRNGAITHRDSKGNVGRTEAGDVQVMSAGTGIFHSEFNLESEDTNLFQIWIYPRDKGIKPKWDSLNFPKTKVDEALPLLVSGFENDLDKDVLNIHQDARIFGGVIERGKSIRHYITNQAYLLVSEGKVAAIGSIAPGALGGLRGLVPLRMMLGNIAVHVVPNQASISFGFEAFDDKDELKDERHLQMLKASIDQFVQTAQLLQ